MNEKILIVEDNPVNMDIFQEIFEEDYQLEMVTDGQQALSVIDDYMPDLVLLDIMMPKMNGYEVCKHIRSNDKIKHVKVIMVSARAMESEQQKGIDAGADAYITKPFDENELLDKVKSYFN